MGKKVKARTLKQILSARKIGNAIEYRLFSELPAGKKREILKTASKVKLGNGGYLYKLPLTDNSYFSMSHEDMLLAVRRGEILGAATFAKPESGSRFVILMTLFVSPEHRRSGIGTKLFLRMKVFAEKKYKRPLGGTLLPEVETIEALVKNRPRGRLGRELSEGIRKAAKASAGIKLKKTARYLHG